MEEAIYKTLHYFALFDYPPTLEESWMFLSKKISKKSAKQLFSKLITGKRLITDVYGTRVTLPGYSSFFSIHNRRSKISELKKKKAELFIHLLSYFPWIHLAGYSGSVSMDNAVESDDIDVFIITKSHRMWTARFFAVITAWILGMKRPRSVKRSADTICLNLFFDESDMRIPVVKQTAYVAHEVLQMKVIFQKSRTYVRFIASNKWVFSYYPNAAATFMEQTSMKDIDIKNVSTGHSFIAMGRIGEWLLQRVQLAIMKKPRTKERVEKSQLWFFPDDFEDKVRKI
ncbi:MAG: hypothetical protein NUV65_06280 [Candidatus Roizmanbacteria bacterium]|nr:hypothetical protein [Candidatus Roizmanbacteria bacterium]